MTEDAVMAGAGNNQHVNGCEEAKSQRNSK